MKKITAATIFAMLFLWTQPLSAAMDGGVYSIPVDSISMSVGGAMSGGDYSLEGSSGEVGADVITSGTSEVRGGFWGAIGSGMSYSLDKSSITLSFGSNPTGVVASDSLILTVTTDSITGYAATVVESGNLASGANDINDVSDGEVTAGSEEYGIRTTGGNGQLATDTAIAGTVTVASATAPVSSVATTVTFRAAASSATQAGSYSHTVTFSVTANP